MEVSKMRDVETNMCGGICGGLCEGACKGRQADVRLERSEQCKFQQQEIGGMSILSLVRYVPDNSPL